MSDTIEQECKCCATDGDCIEGLCGECRQYHEKFQKQIDLLTLGLLQEKDKNRALQESIKLTLIP